MVVKFIKTEKNNQYKNLEIDDDENLLKNLINIININTVEMNSEQKKQYNNLKKQKEKYKELMEQQNELYEKEQVTHQLLLRINNILNTRQLSSKDRKTLQNMIHTEKYNVNYLKKQLQSLQKI